MSCTVSSLLPTSRFVVRSLTRPCTGWLDVVPQEGNAGDYERDWEAREQVVVATGSSDLTD